MFQIGQSNKYFGWLLTVAKQDDHTYMAVIIGILMAVIILLAVLIFLIVSRHRQRKCFASPLAAKSVLPGQISSAGSSCGTEKAYSSKGTLPLGPDTALLMDLKGDEYQEPYQALKYAPYYSYSTVVMEMRDSLDKQSAHHPSGNQHHMVVSIFFIFFLYVHFFIKWPGLFLNYCMSLPPSFSGLPTLALVY